MFPKSFFSPECRYELAELHLDQWRGRRPPCPTFPSLSKTHAHAHFLFFCPSPSQSPLSTTLIPQTWKDKIPWRKFRTVIPPGMRLRCLVCGDTQEGTRRSSHCLEPSQLPQICWDDCFRPVAYMEQVSFTLSLSLCLPLSVNQNTIWLYSENRVGMAMYKDNVWLAVDLKKD